jgi:hypothetical protein
MKKLERFVKSWLRARGVYFGKKTTTEQLDEFFKRVRPVTTNHNLVRIGDKTDGGYLLPDDFADVNVCFSPGVSLEIHFEAALGEKGIKSYLADSSIDSLPIHNPMFDFEKKFLGMENDAVHITLDSWVDSKAGKDEKDMILQMDIEGCEYEIIFDASNELLKRFRIIIIEFHKLDSLLDKFGYQIINTAFRKLLKNFDVVHIHPNNNSIPIRYKKYEIPPDMEFTFLRKDRITRRTFTSSFPHELDEKNMSTKNDLILPACWHQVESKQS